MTVAPVITPVVSTIVPVIAAVATSVVATIMTTPAIRRRVPCRGAHDSPSATIRACGRLEAGRASRRADVP